jgi:putative dimethyl sulfoxide reductase chaperone
MSTTSENTAPAPDLEQRLARADLYRFLAACYYQPAPEFVEERLFDSMAAAAARIDPDLARCARRLGEAFGDETLENLLIDYTRLFLGPGEAFAKPYGAVWMSGESLLMQESTMAVLAMYAEAGFDIDENFRELPDHIAAELEFLFILTYLDTAESLRRRFLGQQLGRWARPFTDAVKEGAETAFYRELAELTERAVAMEAGRAGRRP